MIADFELYCFLLCRVRKQDNTAALAAPMLSGNGSFALERLIAIDRKSKRNFLHVIPNPTHPPQNGISLLNSSTIFCFVFSKLNPNKQT